MKIQKPVLYTGIAILIAAAIFFISSFNNTAKTRSTFRLVSDSYKRLEVLNSIPPPVIHLQMLTTRAQNDQTRSAISSNIHTLTEKLNSLQPRPGLPNGEKIRQIKAFVNQRIEAANIVLKTNTPEPVSIIEGSRREYQAFTTLVNDLQVQEKQRLASRISANEKAMDTRVWYSLSIGLVSLITLLLGLRKISKENFLRRKAERLAIANETKFRNLIENASVVMYTTDTSGKFNYVSSKCLELTGYTESELIGRSFDFLISKDHREETANFYLKQLMQSLPETVLRFPIVAKGGHEKWVEQSVVLLKKRGRFSGFQSIVKDVTETRIGEDLLRQAEENLRLQSERNHFRLQAILDNIPMIVYIKELDGKFLMINERFRQAFNMKDEDVIGKYSHDVNKTAGVATQYVAMDEAVKEMLKPVEVEDIVRTVDGERHMLVTKFPLFDKDHNLFAISGVDIDITEMVKFRQELIAARQRAEQAEKLQEEFLANMSHEIRTPMNGIMGMASLLTQTTLTEEQEEYVDLIRKSSDGLLSLINDILDLSKIKAGRMSVEVVDFSINDVIDTVITPMKIRTKEKGVSLKKNVNPNIVNYVKGDQHKLTQILNNLLSNAVKFTESGEITVTVNELAETEGSVEIEFIVSDTGIGISEEYINSIFESFVQAGDDMVRRYGGTGLGLAITKRLVEMQGGNITVKSSKNKGSTFRFAITYSKSNAAQEVIPFVTKQVDRSLLKGRKILLVEDNLVNQKVTEKMLSKAGLHVEIAGNGMEAIEKLEKGDQYDLVIMDLQMPEMDGFQTTVHIREKLKMNIPIIAMTASALRNERMKCKAVGMNEYIAKPFAASDLFFHLHRLIIDRNLINEDGVVEVTPEETLYSLAYLQEMDDTDYTIEVLKIFLETTPVILEEIGTNIALKNWPEVRKAAHKVRSSMGILKMKSVLEDVVKIEDLAHQQKDLDLIPVLLKQVNEKYNLTEPKLLKELEAVSPGAVTIKP